MAIDPRGLAALNILTNIFGKVKRTSARIIQFPKPKPRAQLPPPKLRTGQGPVEGPRTSYDIPVPVPSRSTFKSVGAIRGAAWGAMLLGAPGSAGFVELQLSGLMPLFQAVGAEIFKDREQRILAQRYPTRTARQPSPVQVAQVAPLGVPGISPARVTARRLAPLPKVAPPPTIAALGASASAVAPKPLPKPAARPSAPIGRAPVLPRAPMGGLAAGLLPLLPPSAARVTAPQIGRLELPGASALTGLNPSALPLPQPQPQLATAARPTSRQGKCECPKCPEPKKAKRKEPRENCRFGYFRETPNSVIYKAWGNIP